MRESKREIIHSRERERDHSFIRSLVRSFVHSFVHSFVQERERDVLIVTCISDTRYCKHISACLLLQDLHQLDKSMELSI